jgi:hypothetical protein
MTRGRRGAFARLALSACGGLTLLPTGADANGVAPFRTALAVRWGEGAGSDAFRDDLARALAATLAGRCFAGLVIADRNQPPADVDLVFAVVLSRVADETRFDDSIATTLQPGEPAKELRRLTSIEVTVDATLTTRATGALVRRKHFVASVSRRPNYVGEDPQATVRAEVIDDIVADLAGALGCGGAKLERKIRDALGTAAGAPSGPR